MNDSHSDTVLGTPQTHLAVLKCNSQSRLQSSKQLHGHKCIQTQTLRPRITHGSFADRLMHIATQKARAGRNCQFQPPGVTVSFIGYQVDTMSAFKRERNIQVTGIYKRYS